MDYFMAIVIAIIVIILYSLVLAIFEVIAPLTRTKVDDIILDILQHFEKIFLGLFNKFFKK